jgi:hypothetical protein
MATLFNTRISDTYFGLIKTIDNAVLSATLRELSDGAGNGTGLSLNNAGDFKVNAILEFGSLKDSGENIIISKFVDAADGIGNNDNDTSIPTSAAVVAYVAGQITAEDLDFRGDDSTVLGDVDLNSQAFIILGTANEIETSVTSAGGNTLQIGLPSSITVNLVGNVTGDLTGVGILSDGSTAVTQGAGDSSTKIATTKFVMDLDAGSDLDFSGDSGTGDVTLNTQSFAVTGITSEIVTTALNQGLTVGFPTTGVILPNGSTATTQASSDDSTKIATTAYVKGLDNASDLDFTDGTTSGDVNLNTQSLSILGTASQVVSTVSNQSVTLSLPSSINVNSASATILQNARDISLTGEASGTISSFNGSANVSGAVTLNNDSVTGKVLTGLASPTATNILASDSILQAFGKTQSQLNTLAGGLRFMGTWNATTNTPTLASGGGETASGTTTGTTANKLVDSGGGFTNALVGDQVVNQASGAIATVTGFDSSTVLSLSVDIMVSGQEYTIDNSPFLTQGHYYVVSVGGTSSLNGLSNWAVGDWVIAGATNVWEKLDHTQVDGTGTVGNITKWSSTNVIADSIMAESGSTISVTGSLSTSQLLSSGGNFEVNTNKFTANATTGNTAFSGDLAINTNKFTVNATSGNVAVAGTISVASGTISVLGGNNMTLSGPASHGGISFATNSILPATAAETNDNVFDLGATTERFKDLFLGGSITAGGATFAGDIMPSAENLYDIGSASVRWEDIWADQVYGRSLYVDDYIYHNGDTDTYIQFQADRQTYLAGGDEFIDFREATESYITIGNSNDTDTRMQGGAGYIFIQGSNGYIGINDATPSYPLEVAANTHIGGTLEIASTSTYQAKIKSTGAQYLLIGSTDAGSAGIVLDGDSNGDGSGGDYSYLLHTTSGVLTIQQNSPSGTNELHFGTAGTESRMIMTSTGDVVVGGTAVGSNTSFSIKSDGVLDQRWLAGTAHSQVLNVIPGLSNGFQTIQDTSNNLTYRFHRGTDNLVLLDINSSGAIFNSQATDFSNAVGPQLRFFEPGRTYSESMRLIRFEDNFGFHYGENANEEAFTVNTSGNSTAHKGLKVNTTISTLGKLSVKSESGANTFYNNIQCVPSDATTGGLFIGSNVTNDAIMVTGAYYQNAGNYTPTATSASIINMFSGNIVFRTNHSLTVGTNYVPTERMKITSGGAVEIGPAANKVIIKSQGSFQNTTLESHIINADGTGSYGSGDLLIQPRCSSVGSNNIIFGTSGGTNTTTERMRIRSGGGIINQYRTGINVGQSATAITSASTYGGMAMIWQNYVGNIGYDLVTWTLSQVTVLASQSISGGASARSYTAVSGVLKLTMGGSDTYQVYVSDITNSNG